MTTSGTGRASGRRPNRRGEGQRLRDDIVQAATRLLREPGQDSAITLRSVAREAGISAPSIYAHFPNPAAITAAVVVETFRALTATLRQSRTGVCDPVERLSAQCYAYLRFAGEQPGLYRVLFTRDRWIGSPSMPRGRDDGVDLIAQDAEIVAAGTPAFNILVGAISDCVTAGRSASQDPFLDAVALWSALHGYITLRMAAPEFPWPDEWMVVDAMIAGQAKIHPT